MAKKEAQPKSQSAFMKPLQPDESLAALVGQEPLPRSQVVKKVWAYIKEHGLQDSRDKRLINADELLATLFGERKQVSMFEMPKLLHPHLKDVT